MHDFVSEPKGLGEKQVNYSTNSTILSNFKANDIPIKPDFYISIKDHQASTECSQLEIIRVVGKIYNCSIYIYI